MLPSVCCTRCTRGAKQVACSLLGPHDSAQPRSRISSTCLGTLYPIAVARHTCVCSFNQDWAQGVEVVTTRRHPITCHESVPAAPGSCVWAGFPVAAGYGLALQTGRLQHQWVCPQQPQTVWCSSLLGPACKAPSTAGIPHNMQHRWLSVRVAS